MGMHIPLCTVILNIKSGRTAEYVPQSGKTAEKKKKKNVDYYVSSAKILVVAELTGHADKHRDGNGICHYNWTWF